MNQRKKLKTKRQIATKDATPNEPDEREITMAELPEEKIYKALDQLMSACGLSGKRRTEELFSVLSEAMRAVEQQGQTLEGERDVNAWLANQIAKIVVRKKMEK